ncbi:S24 family peptidase [Flavisphingopyxis soli]|uniref:S24 family peptidase n=1 Tax=Flavisphingopyxis soli TaxID=2601267 RepID=UPI00137596F9|nr:S24 family peptidase [Sphingorhabdus soli]
MLPSGEIIGNGDNAPMSKRAEILAKRIGERLDEMGKTAYWLSMQITDGSDSKAIANLVKRKGMPRIERMEAIAKHLNVSADWLLGKTEVREMVRSEVDLRDVHRHFGSDWPGQDLPILGTGHCGGATFPSNSNGDVEIETTLFEPTHVIRMVSRPPALQGVREAYAIYFMGDSMEPRFERGDMGIVDPHRPVRPADYVVVQLNNGTDDDVVTVLVKRLVRITGNFVELEQFNPARIFRVARTRIARMHRIMPAVDLFGG